MASYRRSERGNSHSGEHWSIHWQPRTLEASQAWSILGTALVCDGEWKLALKAFAKSRDLGYAGDGEDWIYEVLAHAQLGNMESARAIYDRTEAWYAAHPGLGADDECVLRRRAEVAKLLGLAKKP